MADYQPNPGPLNLLTDVDGFRVGQAEDEIVQTGVTVILCDDHYAAGAAVAGGGPGTREIDVLEPENLVGKAHGFVLSGGSVFGLGAADGVVAHLSSKGTGLKLSAEAPAVPIVPSAILYDLSNGGEKEWGAEPPYRKLGLTACQQTGDTIKLGRAGAGFGARAGRVAGGLGSVSLVLEGGLKVGALMAANPSGTVYMEDDKTFWAWPYEAGDEFGGRRPGAAKKPDLSPIPRGSRLSRADARVGTNTVIGFVGVNADLTSAECKRIALMAHDGIARAVRPAHTLFDGDTIFAAASGAVQLGEGLERSWAVTMLGAAAADCVARAIARGVYCAE